MKHNIGSADKVLRIIIGLVLLSLIFILDGTIRWIGLIGIMPIITAFAGNCPLYSVLGVNTCATPKKEH